MFRKLIKSHQLGEQLEVSAIVVMHRESAVPEHVHRVRLEEVVPARGGHQS